MNFERDNKAIVSQVLTMYPFCIQNCIDALGKKVLKQMYKNEVDL